MAFPSDLQYRRCVVGDKSTVGRLSFSPDGRFLSFVSPGRDSLGLMNLKTGKVVRRWGEDLSIESISFSPDSNILAAVEFMYGTIHLYDVASGKEITSVAIPGDVDDLFFDAKRKRIYASCGEGFLAVLRQVDADHYELLEKIATVKDAWTCFFDAETSRLYLGVPRQKDKKGPEIRVYQAP